ncbi:MAG: histidine kinase [Flavobacteriales bacterium]
MSLKQTLCAILCLITCSSLHAQKYSFLNYTVDDGLAHSQVRSIFQDSNAELWIGTLAGISRFDGQEFVNYSIDDGLVNNEIRAINQAEDGTLIFGGIGGISEHNGREFTNFKFKEDWKDAAINHILLSGDSLLISTEEGLTSFKNGMFTYYPTLFSLNDANLRSVLPYKDGLLILTTKTLNIWTPEEFTVLVSANDLAQGMDVGLTLFNDMAVDVNQHVFITTSLLGLLEYFDDTVEFLSKSEGLASARLGKIIISDSDELMICSEEGVSHIKQKEINAIAEKNGLRYTDVRTVIQDNEGRFWLGTNGGGLFKFTGYLFTYYTTDEGLSSNAVMTISKNASDFLSFGTFDGGISINSPEGWSYLKDNDLNSNTIWTSTTDGSGKQWFGTSRGIHVVKDKKVVKTFSVEGALNHAKTTALWYDKLRDATWVGNRQGINLIQGDSVYGFEEFKGKKIRAIESSDSGEIFFGSSQGVWMYTNNEFKQLDITSELDDRTVYCLKWLGNKLWVGTKNGLFTWAKNEGSQKVVLSSNLSVNAINFLESDPDERLWVGTNLGLFLVGNDLSIESFSKQDGLTTLETNLNSVYSDDLNLWFGTSEALQCLNYAELARIKTLKPLETVLTDVRLNLEKTDWASRGNYFISGTNIPLFPEVTYKNNNFSFRFHSKSVEEAKNLRYQYMLEGFDQNWQPVTAEASATYTNLPYKDFVFKVRSKRLSQSWGEPFEYAFSITPPFWQTWWFILLAIGVTSYISYSVFQYRRRNLITALEKEKFEIKSKMLALEQQSLNSSMNRHFIFNALNSIQYYINRQDRLAANRYLSSFAKLIRKNLDSSQVNFTSLADEIERLSLYLEIENMRFKDKFDYSINVAHAIDEEVVQIPSMLLQPYLENSIWHGILPQEKKGEISVDIDRNEIGQMEIRIKDNGIGISTSQAQKNGKAAHISKGMSITSGRIDLLRKITNEKVILIGPFELTDDQGEVLGTQVTIKLPIEYKEEDLG